MTKNVNICPEGDRVRGVSLALLLMVGLAFLMPFRVWPFNTLIEEFALGIGVVILAGGALVVHGRYWVSPLLAIWVAFGGVLLVSAVCVPRVFDSTLFAYAGFWLVGLALTQLAPESSWLENSQRFSLNLAWFLVIVGGFSVVLACVKHYQLWGDFGRYLPAVRSGRMNGVIGQSNLFAVLCILGVMATLWLVSARRMLLGLAVLLVLLFCFALVLAGSRVVGLIYLAVLIVALAQGWRQKECNFFLLMLGFGLLIILMQPPIMLLDQLLREQLSSLGIVQSQYVAEDVFSRGGGSLRWAEWPLAWRMFLEHLPWGIGPGAYAAQSYAMHLRDNVLPLGSIWLHSHNSYLQLWVEFGFAGVCWSLAMGWLVCKVLWRAVLLDQPVQAMVMLALLIYSFFEFPLWFVHFFVLGFWVLAAGVPAREIRGKPFLGWLVISVTSLAMLFYGSLFAGLVAFHVERTNGEVVQGDGLRFVDRVVQDPLLKPYGLQFYYYYFASGNLPIEMELQELEQLRAFLPYQFFSMRYSVLLAASGRRDEALKVRDELFKLFPAYIPDYVDGVGASMQARPDWRLQPLVDGLRGVSVD